MSFTFNSSRSAGILLALVVLVSAMGIGFAAAPTVDTETINTASTSELTDGDTVANFNASDVNISTLQMNVDSTDPGLKIVDPETNETIKSITADSEFTQTYNDSTNSTYHYNVTLQQSDFSTVAMDASENKTVTLRMVNNTSASNPDTSNITIYLENTDERAVVRAGSTAESSGLIDITEDDPSSLAFWAESMNHSTLDTDNVGINGTNTTVYVVYADADAAAPYEAAAEDKKGLLFSSDYEEGDRIKDQQVMLEGTHYAAYSDAAPDDVADKDEATYAAYETLDGEPTHRIELGEDFEGETSVDVETVGNDTPGFTTDVITYEDGFWQSLSMSMSAAASVVA